MDPLLELGRSLGLVLGFIQKNGLDWFGGQLVFPYPRILMYISSGSTSHRMLQISFFSLGSLVWILLADYFYLRFAAFKITIRRLTSQRKDTPFLHYGVRRPVEVGIIAFLVAGFPIIIAISIVSGIFWLDFPDRLCPINVSLPAEAMDRSFVNPTDSSSTSEELDNLPQRSTDQRFEASLYEAPEGRGQPFQPSQTGPLPQTPPGSQPFEAQEAWDPFQNRSQFIPPRAPPLPNPPQILTAGAQEALAFLYSFPRFEEGQWYEPQNPEGTTPQQQESFRRSHEEGIAFAAQESAHWNRALGRMPRTPILPFQGVNLKQVLRKGQILQLKKMRAWPKPYLAWGSPPSQPTNSKRILPRA